MNETQPNLHPLTSPQREIWYDQILHEGIPLYNIGGYVKIPGAIDPVLFEQAVNLLVQKHDTLRTMLTKVADEDGVPMQTIASQLAVTLPVRDFAADAQPDDAALAWMQQRFIEPFELTKRPLFRYDLLKIREDYYYWLLQYHHLIIDGYGIAMLNRSLAEIYTHTLNGQTPNLDSHSYISFIENDRAYIESAIFDKQRQYWLSKYPTPPEPLFTPHYRSNYTDKLIGSGCEVIYLPRDFYNRLNKLAKQHNATLFHLLLGAFYVYFTRTAQRDDFAIGLPVLNRANANFKKTAGLFTGVSPTLFNFGKDLSFAELLRQINKTLKANYRHQRFPVSEINRAVGLGLERSQLFDINLSYENHDYDASFDTIESYFTAMLHPWEQIPLMIFVRDFHKKADVKFDFVFNLTYFNTNDIKALQARFVTILEAILKDSVSPIYTLPIMTEQEVHQLQAWNDTVTDFPKNQTIVDLFEQQVEKTPENIAVVFETQVLSYEELNKKANQVAHYLMTLGVKPEVLVGICVERSIEMVIGLLGILKAGGAYVPIDPSYPMARINYMLEDSATPVLLTQNHLKKQLPELKPECVVVCLDEVDFVVQETENLGVNRRAEDLAYVIYTSGSTGRPKGVSLPQAALVNLLHWQVQQPSLDKTETTLQFTSLSFDVSFQEIFSTFFNGGQLVLVNEETRKDASALLKYLSEQKIERLFMPYVMLQHLAQHLESSNHDALRLQNIITAGEQLHITPAIHSLFKTLPQCRLYNQYGPSESHVVTAFTLSLDKDIWMDLPPIGQPIANTRIYILDAAHQPQPPNLPGELCIAGAGLARSYLNRPELTAEKFIEVELFSKTERIYKTGDLARWLPDGNLEYLGRIDNQVKLRGFRIELGEIEAVLSQHEAVKEAVVTLYEADDNKRLVAYLKVKSEKFEGSLFTELKEWLKTRLPDYMVPSHFTVLDKLPLTPNGKIDRKALPAPEIEISTGTKPATPTEELLAGLMAFVLKCEAINQDDNFFELGGHSLLATQLIARIRDSFQIELPVRAIFEHPQLSTLAKAIETATGTVSLPAIEVQSEESPKILSYAQQRLWFLNQFEDNGSATYNMPAALLLSGELNLAALQQSLHWLQERHASLRTYFPTHAGKATAQIQTIDKIEALRVHDLRMLTDEVQNNEVQNWLNSYALTKFDLATGPLFKTELLQLNETQSVLLLNMHHIISDGWSMGVFIRDWQHAYTAFAQNAEPSLASLTIQYSDYAAWQRNWLQGEVLQQQVDYWMQQLIGSPELLELPTDKPRPPQQSYQGAHYAHWLSATLSQSVTLLSQQQGVTVFMTLLASFNILLSRYSRQNDISVGSPIANRTHSQTEDIIGFFVNTLVLHSRLQPQQSFIDLLLQIRQTCLEANAHQDIPFEMLVEQLQPTRRLSHHPLFQVMLVLQNNEAVKLELPGLDITTLNSEYPIAKFDLTLNLVEQDGQFECVWEYASDLFEVETIKRMAGHFEVLLTAIVKNPEQSISQLPLLTENEVQQLQAWNDTVTDFPKNQTIVDLFEQQVEKTPDNIAVVFETQELSYEELNRKANQVAHYLMTLGVKPEVLVGICVERSIEMVIGLLGILKAGGAYVPIDPSYPPARISYMLEDSATPVLLTQNHLKKQLPELKHECVVVCLDEVDFVVQETENPDVNRHIEDLAYVIYTSGSTGKPKGVMVEHQALALHSQAILQQYTLNENDRVLQFASFSFDTSLEQLLVAWLSGAGSVLVKSNLIAAQDLLSFLQNHTITVVNLPPAYWQQMLDIETTAHVLSNLRILILGGEALQPRLAQQTIEYFPALTCFNAYGPTEAVITPTIYRLSVILPDNTTYIAIGRPRTNTRIYILDAAHQPQPPNIPGELCIAGAGLARGYLNRPELTAEKFIEVELFGKTERIYKTGDLARWLPDGNLEYLGRIDNQVKLRGFRIELGEIEAVLSQHSAVKEAVVTLYEADDNKRLVAYLKVKSEKLKVKSEKFEGSLVTELKKWLKTRLPDYMVPSHFTVLDKLPLTTNGKIDRKALPAPEIEISTGAKPATPTEDLLAGLMAFVLKCEAINRDDNFFELGGHSLLATQLIARIRDSFQIELPVRAIFEHPQLSTLAKTIETATGTVSLPAIEVQSENSPKILSYAQQRLWFLNQFEDNGSATYNMPAALLLSGELNLAALQQSLHWLQERHASLRTYFPTHAGKATAQIQTIDKIEALRVNDLRMLTDEVQNDEVQNRANSHALTKFDFGTGPLFKAELLQLNETQSVLLLNMHHIISDGWSMGVFIRDWQHAYTAFAQNAEPSLASLTIQYSDYAAWQRNWLQGSVLQQQVDYWTQQLIGSPELLELPTDKPRPPQQSYQGAHYAHWLSATLSQSVTLLSQQQGVTVFMTLLASFNILLSRYSRQNDISVGSPIANRTHSQTEDIIGFFVNTLVLHSRLQPQQSFIDLLLQTRQTCLEANAHQDIPFEMLVEQLQPTRSLSHHPLFQVMLVLQNNEAVKLELPGLDITTLNSEYPIAKFDLTLNLVEQDGQFECVWEYATDLFEAETIKRMAGHFEVLLGAIVENPEQSISQLPMLTENEVQQLQAWNDTVTDFPKNQTIIDLFEQQVEKTPENIAVVFETQELSYEELNRKANQVAHYLMTLGVKPEVLVGICVERSIEMVIGLLGILKAGGAYVPIDPSYPPARISYMLEDSATPMLLTQSHLRKQLPELKHECVVVCLDEVDFVVQETKNPDVNRHVEDLAYVIYTSGSTGKPKGVMVECKGLVNLALAQISTFRILSKSRVLQFASFSFDASVSEITTTLLSGATLHLVPKAKLLEPTYFTDMMVQQQISHITLPPSFLSNLSDQALSGLKTLVVAGEACPADLVKQWVNKVRFINAYGPTESTVCASVALCFSEMDIPPIGKPLANTCIYVLDAVYQPQPPNISGELCIAGTGLARGYLNRPELTAEKFIEVELFGKIERIYKTGDLARWLPDGNLEYLGRIDNQVKLRGFRIELGEIEAVLSQHSAVKEAVVTLYEADDNKRLVAYLKVKSEKTGDLLFTELKEWLKTRLPDYMVPSHFTVLDKLPLTPNGKIDRKALPAPELNFSEAYEAPRNDIEQQLAQIWSSLLKLTNISIHDNFFSLGGDSILSIQIVARARQAGLHFTPRDLFEHQTIAELAMVVGFGIVVDAEPGLVTGESSLTSIQHWFFAQDLPEYWHFNQSILLRVAVDLEVDALRQALAAVLSHHDALRLRYHQVNGDWQQSFAPPEDTVPLSIEDLSQCEKPVAELQRLTQSYQTSLNLTDGPLTHLVLFKLTDEARLFWCIHHLVVDGVSWRILQEDLQTAYTQIAAGRAPQLPAKTSSFKVWAERLKSYAVSEILSAELANWQALPTLTLPVDNLSGLNRLEHHKDYTITLNRKQTEVLLRSVPKAYNTQINDILLTALALALADWTKKSSCLIDLEGHGRADLFDDIDLSRTVGWFTTIHPIALRLPLSYNEDLGAALKAIKEQLRAIPSEGIGYGLLTQIGGNVLPKGDILFNYLGQFDQGIEADFEFANETTGFDVSLKGKRDHLIDINGAITKGQLSLNWSYSGDCYLAATIKKLAESYKIHLQDLINHCQSGKQGVTPSDFPLAPVLPSTLDALYTQYSGLQDLYPLSPMQQGMLFHALYEPSSGVYFEQMQLTLSNLEPTAFKAAWQHQLERHSILRTAFLTEHQPILQLVQTEVPLLWREHDWRGMSLETQDQQLSALLQEERSKGFDLNQAPLMRFDLIRLDEQHYEFIQHHHHILMDGWCLPITFSEVRDSYLAFKQGKTPQLSTLRPYRDYIAWLQQQDSTKSQHYWQQRLAGFIAPTKLPIIKHKAETPDYREASYCLDVVTSQQLQHFCKEQRVTLNTLVQGAYALLLSRYSRETDICFGVTVSGRNVPLSGIEQMIGLFINTLPLRIDANSEYCVKDYLQQVQTQHQNDNRYAHSPLFEIQTNSEVPNGTALFESLLVFENYPLGDALEPSAECYQIEDFHGIEYTNYPLTLAIIPGEVLGFKVSYDNSRISQDSIERLWGHLNTLLTAIVENPEQSISQLPMLTENEVQQLQAWNDTVTDFPKNQTIVDLFEQQVEKTPENIAVVFETQELSYEELNRKANQIAHYLMTLGVKPEVKVGICVERSIEMVIGLLGILKAGGAYVPIDPSYPPARIGYMLEDSATPVLLTQNHLKKQLLELKHECVVVCLDEVDFAVQETENPDVNRHVEDLAYVIYTSGSTGKPKGVMVEHQALALHSQAILQQYTLNENDRVLQFASFSFDTSLEQLLVAWLSGAGSVLVKSNLIAAQDLLSFLQNHAITVVDLPPAYWQQMLDIETTAHVLSNLRILILGGEALPISMAQQTIEYFPALTCFNAYGPTEAVITPAIYHLSVILPDNTTYIAIGRPRTNTRIYILDAAHQPQPPWIPGELCIAGAGLARGYLNRPELTAEKFIEVELFGKTERIYKTGDLARWLPDGNLEYLGRIDNQVKLRGFRIELGEIEAVLSQHSAVKEAVVTLYEADDNKRLVAYLKVKSEKLKVKNEEAGESLFTELKEWLKTRLPDYMVPSHFTVLDKLPLTPNGKIDRKALPAPDSNTLTLNTLPRDAIELQLLSVWETVLDVHPLGIHDNFFELGGHSLLAVKLMSHIQQQCGVRLPVSALFQSPTVATLAQQLRQDTTKLLTNLVPIQVAGEKPPVYCLPGAIGSVMYLYPLASYLGQQQPFYALQTPGLDGSTTPETVEKLARFHLQALRQQQPNGPYQLMGHSSGGRVAFEMAWQLEQQGETVAFLGILDTNAPDRHQSNPMTEYTELNGLSDIVLVFEELTGVDLNMSLQQLQAMPDLETAYVQVMQAFVERQILFAPGAPVDELKALVNTYRITVQGHADYQIHSKLRCPIHLFRSREKTPNAEEIEFEDTRESWGWTECTHAKVEELMVPGTHVTMMALPHVRILAEKLSAKLSI